MAVLAWAAAAAAQPVDTAPAEPAAVEATLGEIVVTARRKSESLQQVPQSVTAVTADTIAKLNLKRLEDITAVTPGFSLSSGVSGYSTVASTRGVSFQSESAAAPTVAFYLNDAPVETTVLFQSLFDIGQIEVLRGPQGTVRGISAPSGALTLTTRQPNLSEYGGYLETTLTDQHGRNVNGAVNVPILQDVLGLRVAGIIDQTDVDGTRSLFNALRPKQTTSAVRTSLAFEPSDALNARVMYLHMDRQVQAFSPVAGPGAGYNGPAIASKDRLSVNDEISDIRQHFDVVTAQVDSHLWGHHFSYVGSYTFQKVVANEPVDRGNVIPRLDLINRSYTTQERTSHEFRMASEPAPGRFLDYTVGAFYQWIANDVAAPQPTTLPGFFGSPAAPSPLTIDPRYQATTLILPTNSDQEYSIFGSVTAHFGENTELTLGGRQLFKRNVINNTITLQPGLAALPPSAIGLPAGIGCGPLPASPYPGFCNVTLAERPIQSTRKYSMKRPFIYNVSLSHQFSRDLLVYANTGSSWRYGPAVFGLFNGANDPVLNSLLTLNPETSRSYEIGLKSTLLDGRMRLNVALFRQKFHNLIIRTEPVLYLSAQSPTDPGTPTLFNFTTQVPAVVEGFDIDAAFQITPEWNATLGLSYADGRAENGQVPCNGPIPPGQKVRICDYSGSTSRDPLWSMTVTSEYTRQVRDGMDGFVRGLVTYYPENNRRSTALVIDNYSLVNLYAGVRSQDGAWEASIFAKNAFKTDEVTSLDANPYTVAGSPLTTSSGYFGTTFTPRREVGVNIRYAFGSR